MDEEQSVSVEYALTRREIFQSFVRSVSASPKYRGTILLYAALVGVMALALRATASRSFALKDAIIAAASAAGFLVFISIWVTIRGKTARRKLTISRDGISTEIGTMKGRVPWGKVRVVTDTTKFVLIALTNGNAFFIPNRAFLDLKHRNQFLARIEDWMNASA